MNHPTPGFSAPPGIPGTPGTPATSGSPGFPDALDPIVAGVTVPRDGQDVRDMLERVARGELPVDEAMAQIRRHASEDLGFANVDHHRQLRKGFPEVVFCQGKTPEQVARILASLAERSPQVLGTRAGPEQFDAARRLTPDLQYHDQARVIWMDRQPHRAKLAGVVIVAAGTTDLPVAEEAAITLDVMGHAPQRIFDVGIAGLHRLLPHLPVLQSAHVIVAVAGMEGALPSVLGGLVATPIIAVPTSIGYGASFGGLAALLAMLNSCAPGLAVVNIDNGFGAGYLAASINRRIHRVTP